MASTDVITKEEHIEGLLKANARQAEAIQRLDGMLKAARVRIGPAHPRTEVA